MREDSILQVLGTLDLCEYVTSLRSHGRLGIPREERQHAVSVHNTVRELRADKLVLSREVEAIVELAERVLVGEWFIWENGFTNYETYISDPILRKAIGVTRREPYVRLWSRCRSVLQLLTKSLLSFEISSLAGVNEWYRDNQDDETLRTRIACLREFQRALTPGRGTGSPYTVLFEDPPSAWLPYATDRRNELALLFLTTFPVTCEHDEFLFIRILQMSECCFWGVLTAIMGAIEAGKRSQIDKMVACLESAVEFSSLLLPITQVLKTMPKEHFWEFRDATEGSSAIQSRTYHLIQIYTVGLDPGKVHILAEIPEIRDLLHYATPDFLTLQGLLQQMRERGVDRFDECAQLAMKLDKLLYTYRCLHLGIVHHYLPPEAKVGTGGTPGIPYLRAHLLRRIWPLDSEHPLPDFGELEALGAVRPIIGLTG